MSLLRAPSRTLTPEELAWIPLAWPRTRGGRQAVAVYPCQVSD